MFSYLTIALGAFRCVADISTQLLAVPLVFFLIRQFGKLVAWKCGAALIVIYGISGYFLSGAGIYAFGGAVVLFSAGLVLCNVCFSIFTSDTMCVGVHWCPLASVGVRNWACRCSCVDLVCGDPRTVRDQCYGAATTTSCSLASAAKAHIMYATPRVHAWFFDITR